MRAALGLIFLAGLAACSPAKPAGSKPSAASPAAAPAAAPAPGWMAWEGTDGPAAAAWPDFASPKVVIRCDERRHLLLVIFPSDPADQAAPHETLSVVSAKMTLLADMHFRSPEDVAADDPPVWAEFAMFPPTRMVLAGDQPLSFERSDPAHPAIAAAAPNAALRKIVEGCR